MKSGKSIEIKADLDRVWYIIANNDMQKKWIPIIEEIKVIDDVTSLVYMRQGKKVVEYKRLTVKEEKPNILSVSIGDGKNFVSTNTYRMSMKGENTLLEFTAEVKMESLMWKLLMLPMVFFMNGIYINQQLRAIKKVCEDISIK